MLYHVAFQYPEGSLGSDRIGLPMDRVEAYLAAERANRVLGKRLEGEGKYVIIIDAKTEKVVP